MPWQATLHHSLLELKAEGHLPSGVGAVLSWASQGEDAAPEHPSPDDHARYQDLGLVASGGMGEVRRVRDLRLDRVLVQKVLLSEYAHLSARFWTEACVTARLEHPSIIPVHDFGYTESGRPFFTMKEVRGSTLDALSKGLLSSGTSGLYRLIEALLRVCEATAMAHDQGICHRDIKPNNIMVGAFGEVLLLDWGLARPCGEVPEFVAGTPGFMPPEQAQGAAVATQADVFALGATLKQLLSMCGSLGDHGDLRELKALSQSATAIKPWERPPDAESFGDVLRSWLHQESRQREAQALFEEARAIEPQLQDRRQRAQGALDEAQAILDELPLHAPSAEKHRAWALEDEAAALAGELVQLEARSQALLQNALGRFEAFEPAHQLLADLNQARAQRALERGDAIGAAIAEESVRRHDRGRHAAWLAGERTLSLSTEPVSEAALFRFELHERRMLPQPLGVQVPTDNSESKLPHGSYLAVIPFEGRRLSIPVFLDRDGRWPPSGPTPPLKLPGALAEDDCWVPGGWTQLGDPTAANGLPRYSAWVDSFVIKRDPVTNAEYLRFLNDLVDAGSSEEAMLHVPREGRVSAASGGTPVFQTDPSGHFYIAEDATGDTWDPHWPVVLIAWKSAVAYADWRARQEGLPWRLPTEVEREKAGRGVDGRPFPWGEEAEATWTVCRPGQAGRATPKPVTQGQVDVSVYGVRGCAGNTRDWCSDYFDPKDALNPSTHPKGWRNTKGGSWASGMGNARLGSRFGVPETQRLSLVGLRLARWVT